MVTLKALKSKRDSIRSTRRITSTMKMVSVAKLHRVEETLINIRPYVDGIVNLLNALLSTPVEKDSIFVNGTGGLQRILLVVITSDRGLCGGLNTSLFRQVVSYAKNSIKQGKSINFYLIGQKGISFFNNYFSSNIEDKHLLDTPSILHAQEHVDRIINLFGKKYDCCMIFYNHFDSIFSQVATHKQFLPFVYQKSDFFPAFVEPEENIFLKKLFPHVLSIQFYNYLLENFVSEFAARMTAMENATTNADQLIDELTVTYNQTRQEQITKELITIISGAEAL